MEQKLGQKKRKKRRQKKWIEENEGREWGRGLDLISRILIQCLGSYVSVLFL